MGLKHKLQRGSMLLSVVFIMLVLGLLMAAVVTLSNQSSQHLVYEVQALKARFAAEAVLEKQVYLQLASITADVAHDQDNPLPVADCSGVVQIENEQESQGRVNILATGQCATGQLTVIRNIEVEVVEKGSTE